MASAITVVDPNTARLARLVTAIDTSEQMAALAKLSESNHRFEALFRNSFVPSAVLDLVVAPGRILAANGALGTTVGQRAEQLRMVPLIHLLCHDDRTALLAGLDELGLGVSDHIELDACLYGPTGECVRTTLSLAAVVDAHGRPTSAIAQFASARHPATVVVE
jgi:PAS domain-containing protein